MRWFTLCLLFVCLASTSRAHHPDREHHRIWPRIDLIPPLGNNLPMEYRRRFNRPTHLGGWIAYHIAPSSQEAMAWHDAAHQRAYADHRGRLEKHFFYPKPWEGLRIGPRVSVSEQASEEAPATSDALKDALQSEEDVLSASDASPSASELIEQERTERRSESVQELQQPANPQAAEPQPNEL